MNFRKDSSAGSIFSDHRTLGPGRLLMSQAAQPRQKFRGLLNVKERNSSRRPLIYIKTITSCLDLFTFSVMKFKVTSTNEWTVSLIRRLSQLGIFYRDPLRP